MYKLNDPLLHERDAADLLNISVAWLQKARYLGNGPRWIRVAGEGGRAVRYRHSDLMAYIEANVVETSDTNYRTLSGGANDE